MATTTFTLGDVAWLLSIVIALGGAAAVLGKLLSPINKIRDRVSTLEAHDKSDNRRLRALEEGQKVMISCQLAQIDHALTGNSIDKLKKAKDDVISYLTTT